MKIHSVVLTCILFPLVVTVCWADQQTKRDPFFVEPNATFEQSTVENEQDKQVIPIKTSFNFRAADIESIPDMSVVGLITKNDSKMIAILNMNDYGQHIVSVGKIINIRYKNKNVAIRIKEISREFGVIIEMGTFEGVMIVK